LLLTVGFIGAYNKDPTKESKRASTRLHAHKRGARLHLDLDEESTLEIVEDVLEPSIVENVLEQATPAR